MPGELRPDAECPVCDTRLLALVDTTNALGVTREYIHQKGFNEHGQISLKARRKPKCVVRYANPLEARRIREGLEL